ncbi:hypothetical protein LR48_Vigan543s003100 [Vigna angularis]|uniref:Uncharacterized protein n=1 Tax=Phaseolus angularis TaxID=3914 RepID=A0A0L9TD53_PHAAN|nr:hypothetical protein LR48_Vigan543s003100 [Vigna angularis]
MILADDKAVNGKVADNKVARVSPSGGGGRRGRRKPSPPSPVSSAPPPSMNPPALSSLRLPSSLDCGLRGSPMDEAGDERLARIKQAANDERELDERRQHCLDHATMRQQRGGCDGDVVDAAGREQQRGNNGEARR